MKTLILLLLIPVAVIFAWCPCVMSSREDIRMGWK